jgi:molybdopterin adenylyltransferase
VRSQLRTIVDSNRINLLLTTGGTGLGPRDNTPEATIDVGERVIPGLAEEMRRRGAEKTPRAVLSRGVAVVRRNALIINLPGSPKGAVESLDAIAKLLPHAVAVLGGASHD